MLRVPVVLEGGRRATEQRRRAEAKGMSSQPSRIFEEVSQSTGGSDSWPPRPSAFGALLTPIEAAQYLRLDETGIHTPDSATRTLNYWRDKGELKATKYARRVWYRRIELDRFLEKKTET